MHQELWGKPSASVRWGLLRGLIAYAINQGLASLISGLNISPPFEALLWFFLAPSITDVEIIAKLITMTCLDLVYQLMT